MSKRFELINFLNAHDNFKDNKNNKKLDSFDVVVLLNHYDEFQTLLVEKDQRIAELEEQLKNAIVPKEDKFVIVSNAWKHNKKYGIAKVKQIMTDHYILQTDDYLGTYVPCIQFGKFKTLEEAKQKLAKIKGEKDE